MRPAAIAVVLAGLFIGPAWGAQVNYQHGLTWSEISISGEIEKGDSDKFRSAIAPDIARHRDTSNEAFLPDVRIALNSLGGDVTEAEAIGRIIHSNFFETAVYGDSFCASACVLILIAGVNRIAAPSAHIIIHRPSFDPKYYVGMTPQQERQKYEALFGELRAYFDEVGAQESLLDAMNRVASTSGRLLNHQEVVAFGISGVDPAWQERGEAAEIDQWGRQGWLYLKNCLAHVNAPLPSDEFSRQVAACEDHAKMLSPKP